MKKLLLFIFIICLFPLISSAIPVQISLGDNTLEVTYPQYDLLEQGEGFRLNVHVFNRSDGILLTNSTTDCNLHLYNATGDHLLINQLGFDNSNLDFTLAIDGNNFSSLGVKTFIISCNTTSQGGFVSGLFTVTPTGIETTLSKTLFEVAMIIIILLLLGFAVYLFISNDNFIWEILWFGVAYILGVIFFFFAWQLSIQFLYHITILGQIFKAMFYITGLGFFAVFVFSMFKILKEIYDNKEVQRLMRKGMMEDEARARIKRR